MCLQDFMQLSCDIKWYSSSHKKNDHLNKIDFGMHNS